MVCNGMGHRVATGWGGMVDASRSSMGGMGTDRRGSMVWYGCDTVGGMWFCSVAWKNYGGMINTCDMEWYRVVQKYAALHEDAWSEAESILRMF